MKFWLLGFSFEEYRELVSFGCIRFDEELELERKKILLNYMFQCMLILLLVMEFAIHVENHNFLIAKLAWGRVECVFVFFVTAFVSVSNLYFHFRLHGHL